MLRTNLSTKPFYNDRAVRVGIAAAFVVVAGLTIFNVREIAALNRESAEYTRRADDAERETADLRRQAQSIRQSLSSVEMTAVQQSAQEANRLIDRRVFSWTELFNEFERTLPADVRIAGVEPQFDSQGRRLVVITTLSRSPEALNEFMDRLEASGRFRDVISRQDQPEDEGLTRSVLQGYYEPGGQRPADAPSPTSDSHDAGGNETPSVPPPGPRGGPR
jgi:Tfp pilus assembly protein PilN